MNEINNNNNPTLETKKENLYEGMERSYLLSQDRDMARQELMNDKNNPEVIQLFMSKSDAVIAELIAEKNILKAKAKESNERWVKSNTFVMDQSRKIEYLEDQVKSNQTSQLQGTPSTTVLGGNKDYVEHRAKEDLKSQLSSHFQEELKSGKW